MAEEIVTSRQVPDAVVPVDSVKRRQILDGASRAFLAEGFDGASMGTIAREAGVSKGTLYVYFKSKEELFEAIVEGRCQAEAAHIFNFDDKADIADELQRTGEGIATFMCRPGGLSSPRTIIAIAERMPELGRRFYQAGPARGIASLKHYLEVKVAEGVLEPHDCEVAAAQFIDACVSTMFKPLLFNASGPPSPEQIRHVVTLAVQMFLAAYRPKR